MRLMVHEVLQKVGAASSKKEKVRILRENDSVALRDILRGSMDDTIEFILPEGRPKHMDPDVVGYTPTSLYRLTKRFRYFVKGGPGENMPAHKRERLFSEILESVHPKEGELVMLMKEKGLIRKDNSARYRGLSKKLVQEAFPGLIAENG